MNNIAQGKDKLSCWRCNYPIYNDPPEVQSFQRFGYLAIEGERVIGCCIECQYDIFLEETDEEETIRK